MLELLKTKPISVAARLEKLLRITNLDLNQLLNALLVFPSQDDWLGMCLFSALRGDSPLHENWQLLREQHRT